MWDGMGTEWVRNAGWDGMANGMGNGVERYGNVGIQ